MRARHVESGARVTMALIPESPTPTNMAASRVDGSGLITGFTRAGATRENYHFIGVQFAHQGVFAALTGRRRRPSPSTPVSRLITNQPGALAAFVSDATFQDIGTPADYLRTSLQLAEVEGDQLVGAATWRSPLPPWYCERRCGMMW